MISCITCKNETYNPKFCSRSCAAKYNNKLFPKKKPPIKICSICKESFKTLQGFNRRTRCFDCHPLNTKYSKDDINKAIPIGQYQNKESVKNKHPSWLNAHIRYFNRKWNKNLIDLPCKNCLYDKFVELAHIKPVSSFSSDALLGEVNHHNNVIQLCPNCHWEFDHGLLSLDSILQKADALST